MVKMSAGVNVTSPLFTGFESILEGLFGPRVAGEISLIQGKQPLFLSHTQILMYTNSLSDSRITKILVNWWYERKQSHRSVDVVDEAVAPPSPGFIVFRWIFGSVWSRGDEEQQLLVSSICCSILKIFHRHDYGIANTARREVFKVGGGASPQGGFQWWTWKWCILLKY